MVSTNSDLYSSNCTCYFVTGRVADKGSLPGGDMYLEGPQACCHESDCCLSRNTCSNAESSVTCVASCTDPLFRAGACPQHYKYPNQQWIASARCDGVGIHLRIGCAYHPNCIRIEKENCSCNKSDVLLQNANGNGSFDEIGLLPDGSHQTIVHNPTIIPSAGSISGEGTGLSSAAKAGIGISMATAALLVLAGAIVEVLERITMGHGQ